MTNQTQTPKFQWDTWSDSIKNGGLPVVVLRQVCSQLGILRAARLSKQDAISELKNYCKKNRDQRIDVHNKIEAAVAEHNQTIRRGRGRPALHGEAKSKCINFILTPSAYAALKSTGPDNPVLSKGYRSLNDFLEQVGLGEVDLPRQETK